MIGANPRGKNVDLIIAGSGAGALTAAITAYDAGLEPLIVEKAPAVGGGTAYSGGVVWAPANHVMRRKGIEDSPADALTYLTHAAEGRGDPAVARQYVEHAARVVEQVEEWTGIKWVIWPGQPDYYPDLPGARLEGRALLQHPNSAHDILAPAQDRLPLLGLVRATPHMDFVPGFQAADRPAREAWVAGRAIIGGLWKAVLERGIRFEVRAAVNSLSTERERVVGTNVTHQDGRRETIKATRGVLLNTGGYDWNAELSRRYLPGPPMSPQTPPSNTGDGHVMAMEIGAATALLDQATFHPSVKIPGDEHDGEQLFRMLNAELCKPHSFVVDRRGRRFSSEASYFALAHAWNQVDERWRVYSHVPSYMVFDDAYKKNYGLPCVRPGDELPGWIARASTLNELARTLGIDAAGLADEIALFNADCVEGRDSRFGRGESRYEQYWGDPDHGPNPTMGPITSPPFYGLEVHPSHIGTRGGLVTTPWGEVVHVTGRIIPGLYACGNTAANLVFGAGYGSGSSVGSSMVFGHLSAQRMAE